MISRGTIVLSYRQCGFSLVAAIFLIVIVSLIGVFVVTIGGVQRSTVTLAVQSGRAYQAARAGIEWVAARTVGPNATPATIAAACGAVPVPPAASASTTNNFALNVQGINGFNVSTTCSYTIHVEGPPLPTYNVYFISSTATSGVWGQPDFVQRRIEATLIR